MKGSPLPHRTRLAMLSRVMSGIIAALAVSSIACVAASKNPIEPTTADRAAFMRGVSRQRAIDLLQNPGACGIVLLRARCQSDTAALAPEDSTERKSFETRLAFTRTGDLASYDKGLAEINALALSSQMPWSRDPRATWLELAGITYVEATGPENVLFDTLTAERVDGLVVHAAAVNGTYAQLLEPALVKAAAIKYASNPKALTITLDRAAVQREALVPKLAALFPIAADPAVHVHAGPKGELQLGVYVASFAELVDSPQILLEPQSRAFVVALTGAFWSAGATTPGWTQASLDSALQDARTRTDASAAIAGARKLEQAYLASQPSAVKNGILTGVFTAQGAYNAAVLKDPRFDGVVRTFVGQASTFDDRVTGLARARKAYLATRSGDWRAINATLSAVVEAIMTS